MRSAELDSTRHQDFERFMFAIHSAVIVRNRAQFYLWVQGGLQSFLPHETMLCTWGELGSSHTKGEAFSSSLIDDLRFSQLCQKEGNLLTTISQLWLSRGDRPIVISASENSHAGRLLSMMGYATALCHGCKDPTHHIPSTQGTMFVLLQSVPTPALAPPPTDNWIELLLPYLHVAWLRVCENEHRSDSAATTAGALSLREQQVLQWVREGKTNHEIGYILAISPLTVKNHVQKILRKLGVANRTQAVAIGAKNGLFLGTSEVFSA